MYASLQPMEDSLFLEYGESIMAKEQTENPKQLGFSFWFFKKGLINLNMDSHLLGLTANAIWEKMQENIFSIQFRDPKYNLFLLISRNNMILVSGW